MAVGRPGSSALSQSHAPEATAGPLAPGTRALVKRRAIPPWALWYLGQPVPSREHLPTPRKAAVSYAPRIRFNAAMRAGRALNAPTQMRRDPGGSAIGPDAETPWDTHAQVRIHRPDEGGTGPSGAGYDWARHERRAATRAEPIRSPGDPEREPLDQVASQQKNIVEDFVDFVDGRRRGLLPDRGRPAPLPGRCFRVQADGEGRRSRPSRVQRTSGDQPPVYLNIQSPLSRSLPRM